MIFRNPLKGIRLSAIWSKYGLIVVGNIVFFILLYFFSYRPHNEENRAAEFLSIAQSAETGGRKETAVDLYETILADYEGTRAAETAKGRLPVVKESLSKEKGAPPLPPPKCDEINIEEMLRKGPAVYIATYVAKHYSKFPSDRTKLLKIISENLEMALEWQKVPLKQLKAESEFQNDFFQKRFFEIQPRCKMTSDWIYDDFGVTNSNFFPWHQVTIELHVAQGGEKKVQTLRLPTVAKGETVDMLEFRVTKNGGMVSCRIEVKTEEGSVTFSEEI